MRASAAGQFYAEMLLLEASSGPINWLYFDTVNLATFGLGSMVDAGGKLTSYALALPWRDEFGGYATEAQIAAEYTRLKSLGIQARGGYAYQQYASLFLDQAVVRWDFDRKRASMEANVHRYLPNWDTLRADAQLAVMSLVWNTGEAVLSPSSAAYWQSLTVPLKAGDYLGAADHCLINGKPSERNRRNRRLFLQAERADLLGGDADRLFGTDVRVSAAAVVQGYPSHCWWTQAALAVTGAYTLKLDGEFGVKSLAAFKTVTGSGTVTYPAMQRLAAATKSALGIEVTA